MAMSTLFKSFLSTLISLLSSYLYPLSLSIPMGHIGDTEFEFLENLIWFVHFRGNIVIFECLLSFSLNNKYNYPTVYNIQ